jgi:hypothetical protein
MACNRPDPHVHHWLIPHRLLQCGLSSIFIGASQLSAIFFMQLGGMVSIASMAGAVRSCRKSFKMKAIDLRGNFPLAHKKDGE